MDAENSMELSNRTGEVVTIVVQNQGWIKKHIRKLGHVFEYYLLGISSYWSFGFKGLGFCVGVSFIDQLFNGIIPVRHVDVTYMPYDLVGYTLGMLTGAGVKMILRNREEQRK